MLVYHLWFHPTSYFGEGKFISGTFLEGATKAFAEIKRTTGKPVLLTLRPPPDLNGMREFLAVQESFVAAGFPVFHSLHNLARTMARLAAWNLRAGVRENPVSARPALRVQAQ